MQSQLEYVKCNLCGSDDCTVLFKGLKEDESVKLSEKYSASSNDVGNDTVVRCNECGLIYVNPRLRAEKIVSGYANAVDEKYISQAEGRTSTFKQSLKLIETYRPNKGRILDIGCAAGFFLTAAKDSGWQTSGIEPCKWMVDWGNKNFGLKMKHGTLDKAKFKPDYFDVVTLWDVLEHLPDPKSSLKEVHRILKKDGLLVVNFPNIGSRLARLAGKRWWFLLSVHLYYFTPQTLNEMLRQTGFEPILFRRHYQRLSLGYLVYRVKPYSQLLYTLLDRVVKTLRLGNVQIRYYASQAMVIAKKV